MFRQLLAVVICCALATSGCASASGTRYAQVPDAAVMDKAMLADYVERIPAGSRVRVERTNGDSLRGTLMKATSDVLVVQKHTRVPEPPVEVPLAQVTRVTLDGGGSSTGRTIAIGVATGVGATFGVLLLLAALLSD
jgi:hypothetical protein